MAYQASGRVPACGAGLCVQPAALLAFAHSGIRDARRLEVFARRAFRTSFRYTV